MPPQPTTNHNASSTNDEPQRLLNQRQGQTYARLVCHQERLEAANIEKGIEEKAGRAAKAAKAAKAARAAKRYPRYRAGTRGEGG
ncbi:hypothetical protein BVRB_9g210010 [Beta vulgaris subsp. vulgaris]|nr:hypothetical protein BVRB_9g210010 [Beta vulgaris subsp. vulgaris]